MPRRPLRRFPRPNKSTNSLAATTAATGRPPLLAFQELGETVGDALANAVTLIDGLIVVGGGLSGAAPLFLPKVVEVMNGTIENLKGDRIQRLELKAFNLEDEREMAAFLRGEAREIAVPGTGKKVVYDPLKRVGVGVARLATSHAVAVGAYAFALNALA